MPDECSALRDHKRASHLLGLDLEAAMSLLTGCWEPNTDPLEEQNVLSTSELSPCREDPRKGKSPPQSLGRKQRWLQSSCYNHAARPQENSPRHKKRLFQSIVLVNLTGCRRS